MNNLTRTPFWVVGIVIAALSMILLYVGIRVVLGNEIVLRNLAAFFIFSSLVGSVAGLLLYFRLKIAFCLFIAGLMLGFFEMYRAFLNGMSGWGDLVGLMSLFIWAITGLGAGSVLQLGYQVYKKFKKN